MAVSPVSGPWAFLVIFSVPDVFGRDQFCFVPSKPATMMRAIHAARMAGKAPKGWKVARAVPWPEGARTVNEAAREWARSASGALVL